MQILVFNAGSSTLKFGIYSSGGQKQSGGQSDWPPGVPLGKLAGLWPFKSGIHPDGIGHRVVHGGIRFEKSLRITQSVKEGIASLVELAPLHNPRASSTSE